MSKNSISIITQDNIANEENKKSDDLANVHLEQGSITEVLPTAGNEQEESVSQEQIPSEKASKGQLTVEETNLEETETEETSSEKTEKISEEQLLPESVVPRDELVEESSESSSASAISSEDKEDAVSHPLDELTDQQVIDLIQELETQNRHLQLENRLFESFLKENDPLSLEGLDEIMDFLLSKGSISSKDPMDKKLRLDSYTSITSIAQGKGAKVNLVQKTEMVMKAMEESQASMEKFLKKCHVIKRNLKSELQEFAIRESEIKDATDIFQYSVVTQGVDKLTQRIPAEKFIRYMDEWLKSAQLQIEKLRLRIATLKVQYKKVSQQLIQRRKLGENVHAVDFDQVEIENKHFVEKIEQKNLHLIELKKMNGGANLVLSIHKKFLQKQQEDFNMLKEEIDEKNRQITVTDKECEQAEEELQIELGKYKNCKKLKNRYTVPEVLDYVRLKAKLDEGRKNIKIWSRRKKIQEIALNTCLREMKNLTGRSDVDPSWFEEIQSVNSENSEQMLI
ncbi:hypothetical protein ABEB36_000558 [Hypothenemus hampei]|uniref:Cilia- and flagella-associated protein 263 n=1 Tax=Hypothenemus hampei TaxID=57062 RepID=A0ABD1FC87_HYPHA